MPSLEGIDSFLDELPDKVDRQSCKLLGPTALVVQGLMGILVILSLVYKRHRETPKRPWRIWLFDLSKQIVGQMFVHGVNVLISDIVAHLATENACNLYFLNILLDTTFGVGIIYLILQVVTHILTEKLQWKGFESGVYGTPPSINYWFRQAAVYVFALTTMKLLVIALFAALPIIFDLGEWLLTFLGPSNIAQIIFVMGIFPIVMNVLQFWLIDTIVKGSNNYAPLALVSESRRGSLDPDTEPLFGASDDEDEDDGLPARRYDIENPRPRSISRSRDPELLLPGEPKSLGSGTTTAIASGSTTPAPKPTDTGVSAHAYPPTGVATSPSSASSSRSSSSVGSSQTGSSRRREPPAPLTLRHHKASHPNIEISRSAPPDQEETRHDDDEKWAAWGDEDEDDWAERVGEEEWTGRRLEATKDAVDDVWRHSPNGRTVSVS
ncbi:vacuolar membrane protein-domain-containing protein [Ganoderma leucocontextum]|nr:vacuolar membrane protein-domain-containing protein [Ganoderma leucocontextum]